MDDGTGLRSGALGLRAVETAACCVGSAGLRLALFVVKRLGGWNVAGLLS